MTKLFKSGGGFAVRIPAEFAYDDPGIELQITRLGEVITIYPARTSLRDAVAELRDMPKPPAVEVRDPIDVPERERD